MKRLETSLLTPIYVKTAADGEWPDDGAFYVLSADGLFFCRNHEFFRSCVPAARWPSELERQRSFLDLDFPPVPRQGIEQVVGFFDHAWRVHGGEAAALLAWDRVHERVEVLVPAQVATVRRSSWGDLMPIGVQYETPTDLGDLTVFGDIHSHCDMSAYTSAVDAEDEAYRTGLHVVVGKLQDEPPQFHVEAVADGTRFRVDAGTVVGSYRRRDSEFPGAWKEHLDVKKVGFLRVEDRVDETDSFETRGPSK